MLNMVNQNNTNGVMAASEGSDLSRISQLLSLTEDDMSVVVKERDGEQDGDMLFILSISLLYLAVPQHPGKGTAEGKPFQ